MSDKVIRIGSRGSDLALWQANHVRKQLENAGYTVEIKVIKTKGDRIQHLSFDKIEGKGFFTKEIEECLLNGEIDLAVHSLKDLETTSPEGLTIAAVSERESPYDVLLIKNGGTDQNNLWNLRTGAVVGTSSARRKAWLLEKRPDLKLVDIRGNVPTRIQKLHDQEMNAIVLAEAGLNRLEIKTPDLTKVRLDPETFVPAPAQGVLGLQIRQDDTFMFQALEPINSPVTAEVVRIERGVLAGVGGGCHVPLGAYCVAEDDAFQLLVAYKDQNGYRQVSCTGKDDLVSQALKALKKKSSSLAD